MYVPKRAVKGSIVADQLAESPIEGRHIDIEFPDESFI